MNSECLTTSGSRRSYGILCHRQFADRVREALIPSNANDWLNIPVKPTTQPIEEIEHQPRKCIVIPTPEEKGPRKSRTGFSLLVIDDAVMSPADLPPMARKQISWVGRLTHESVLNDVVTVTEGNENTGNGKNDSTDLQSTLKPVTREIWAELAKSSFDTEKDFLRIDVQPKSFNTDVCTTIITAFNNEMEHNQIKLACSATKVSHVLNIVIQSTSSSTTESPTLQKVFWGISENKEHFEDLNQRLNDYATREVVLESTDEKTGLDSNTDKGKNVQWDDPVSRAYYKLAQVFEDESLQVISSLRNSNETLDLDTSKKEVLSHGAGLDIGASPGGWTQVLHNTVCIPTVVAMDPGVLAQRVMALKGVRHLRALCTSEESIKVLAHHAPYSVIVCDASISNPNELLLMIVETFDRVSSLLKKPDDGNGSSLDGNVFTWPLCLVITLKLPHKTHGSIDRHLEKVNKYIPDYLKRIALLGSSSGDDDVIDVDVRYKICHLFANSTAERTLVAVFNKK